MKCGLLGRTLGHSYSPQIHRYFGKYTYTLFEKEPETLGDFLKNGEFHGLNVTMPYKKAVIPYCDELSDCAERLGAVNTIVKTNDGRLIGHNTDYHGFQSMVKTSKICVNGKKILILGSGGASNTVTAVLNELGAETVVISRNGVNNYQNLHRHKDASVIVNTTPVGMFPNTYASPLDLEQFDALEAVLDVIYNPSRTKLMMDAEKKHLTTMNGLWMLIAQAKESAELFTGQMIPDDRIAHVHSILKRKNENIILIGMPGSGKTTVGRELAARLSRDFVDIDTVITDNYGMTIPDIFQKFGESGFRQIETDILTSHGNKSGLVIATGGGCVTKSENYPLLHQNGIIIWLQRDIRKLPTDGRPLSQIHNLEDMYTVRRPLYEQFADFSVENNSTVQEIIEEILNLEDMK